MRSANNICAGSEHLSCILMRSVRLQNIVCQYVLHHVITKVSSLSPDTPCVVLIGVPKKPFAWS